MGLTGASKTLWYFAETLVLGLSIAGTLIGGIFITLAAGYLFLKQVITVKKRAYQHIFAKHLCARNSHHDIKLIA